MFDFFKKFFSDEVDSAQLEAIDQPKVVEVSGGSEDSVSKEQRRDSAVRSAHELIAARRLHMPETDVVDGAEVFYPPADGERFEKRMVHLKREKGKDTIILQTAPDHVSMFKFAPDVLPTEIVLPRDRRDPHQPASIISGAVDIDGDQVTKAEEFWKKMDVKLSNHTS